MTTKKMMTKINQIATLEQLQMEKMRLKAVEKSHAKSLDTHFEYLQHNLGGILLSSGLNGIRSHLPPMIQGFLPSEIGGNSSSSRKTYTVDSKFAKINAIAEPLLDVLSMAFKGSKPLFAAFLLKKARGWIFRRKK